MRLLPHKYELYCPTSKIDLMRPLMPFEGHTETQAVGWWTGKREEMTVFTVYRSRLQNFEPFLWDWQDTLLKSGEEAVLVVVDGKGRLYT